MLFGSKTTLHPSSTILNSFMQSGELKNHDGCVVIERKEGRKTVQEGRLYFRDALVYAAYIPERPIPIAARVATGGKVEEGELQSIVNRCGSPNSPDVLRQLLVNNLIAERFLDAYVKEHFLDNVSEIMAWQNCTGKWYPGEITKDFTMPNVTLPRLRQIIAGREAKRTEFIKEVSHFFKTNEFPQLTFLNTAKDTKGFSTEVQAVLALCNGENTAENIYAKTGIGFTAVIQTIHLLWKRGDVSLKYGAIELTYASALIANQPKEEEEIEAIPEAPSVSLNEPEREQTPEEDPAIEAGKVESVDESLLSDDEVELGDINEAGNDRKQDALTEEVAETFESAPFVSDNESAAGGISEAMHELRSKYGIHEVHFEDHDDVIAIDPVYFDTGSVGVTRENNEDDEKNQAPIEEEANMNDTEEGTGEASDNDAEIEAESSETAEIESDIEPAPEDSEANIENEPVSPNPEEEHLSETGGEPEPETREDDVDPVHSIAELMELLGKLQAEEKAIGAQLEEQTRQESETAKSLENAEAKYAAEKSEAERLEQVCDGLRDEYEKNVALLEEQYRKLDTTNDDIASVLDSLTETQRKAAELHEQKEEVIIRAEKATRSFSMR